VLRDRSWDSIHGAIIVVQADPFGKLRYRTTLGKNVRIFALSTRRLEEQE
jgi:hypothetical protein